MRQAPKGAPAQMWKGIFACAPSIVHVWGKTYSCVAPSHIQEESLAPQGYMISGATLSHTLRSFRTRRSSTVYSFLIQDIATNAQGKIAHNLLERSERVETSNERGIAQAWILVCLTVVLTAHWECRDTPTSQVTN